MASQALSGRPRRHRNAAPRQRLRMGDGHQPQGCGGQNDIRRLGGAAPPEPLRYIRATPEVPTPPWSSAVKGHLAIVLQSKGLPGRLKYNASDAPELTLQRGPSDLMQQRAYVLRFRVRQAR